MQVYLRGRGQCEAIYADDVKSGYTVLHEQERSSLILAVVIRRDIHVSLRGDNGIVTSERYPHGRLVPVMMKAGRPVRQLIRN